MVSRCACPSPLHRERLAARIRLRAGRSSSMRCTRRQYSFFSSTGWLSIVPSFCCASVLTRAYCAAFVIHCESIPEIALLVESSGVDNETTGETFACMLSSVFSRTGHLQHRFAAVKGTYVQGVCAMSRCVEVAPSKLWHSEQRSFRLCRRVGRLHHDKRHLADERPSRARDHADPR